MPKHKKLFSKVVMITFLLMIVIGFIVPLFNLGRNTTNQPKQAEARLCQSDADCYLICDDVPLTVLCTQNLCQQNSCEEGSLFPYQEQPVTFTLEITIQGETLDLASRQDGKNLFAVFDDDMVRVYSSLVLPLVLEKVGIAMNSLCIQVDGQQYCTKEGKEMKVLVNGEEELAAQYYYPKEGDKVEIVYS